MDTITEDRPQRTLADRMQAARYARTLEAMAEMETGERKAELLRAASEMRTGHAA